MLSEPWTIAASGRPWTAWIASRIRTRAALARGCAWSEEVLSRECQETANDDRRIPCV
jgi:hypothetical protein